MYTKLVYKVQTLLTLDKYVYCFSNETHNVGAFTKITIFLIYIMHVCKYSNSFIDRNKSKL